jgi:hypothetical protein
MPQMQEQNLVRSNETGVASATLFLIIKNIHTFIHKSVNNVDKPLKP